jgi:hypothetical protein
MDSPFIVPLAFFAFVVLIVAIIDMAKVHERETDVVRALQMEEMNHRGKMKELEDELARVKQGH